MLLSSFCQVTDLGLITQQLQQTPRVIQDLVILWKSDRDEKDKDNETLQAIKGTIDRSFQDVTFFKKMENMIVVQSLLNFTLRRIEQLTRQLKDIISEVERRCEVALNEQEFEKHQATEKTIQLYLYSFHRLYPIHNCETESVECFQTQAGQMFLPISIRDGLIDTMSLAFMSETTFLILYSFKLCQVFSTLSNNINRKEYNFNQHRLDKVKGILSTYIEFIYDNKALKLNRSSANFYKDQSFMPELAEWRQKHENFINQAYLQNYDTTSETRSFVDDLDLQISQKNSTIIQGVKSKFTPCFSHLLLAKQIFKQERNQVVNDIHLCDDPYFYILAENLKVLRTIETIEDRKWIPLIKQILCKKGILADFDITKGLVRDNQSPHPIIDDQLVQLTAKRGFGLEYDTFVYELMEYNDFVLWTDIEQQLLIRYKLKLFKQTGLQTYFLNPQKRIVEDLYNTYVFKFRMEALETSESISYLEIDNDFTIDIGAAIQAMVNDHQDQQCIQASIETLCLFIRKNDRIYSQTNLIKNSPLWEQYKLILKMFQQFTKVLIYGLMYLNKHKRDDETRQLIRILYSYEKHTLNSNLHRLSNLSEYWVNLWFEFLLRPLANNPYLFDFLAKSEYTTDLDLKDFRFFVQNHFGDQPSQRLQANVRDIVVPYFLESPLMTFGTQISQVQLVDYIYENYIEFLRTNQRDRANSQAIMLISIWERFQFQTILRNRLQEFKVYYIWIDYALQSDICNAELHTKLTNMFEELAPRLNDPVEEFIKTAVDVDFIFTKMQDVFLNMILQFSQRQMRWKIGKMFKSFGREIVPRLFKVLESVDQLFKSYFEFEINEYKALQADSDCLIVQQYLFSLTSVSLVRSKNVSKQIFDQFFEFLTSNQLQIKFDEMTKLMLYIKNWWHFLGGPRDFYEIVEDSFDQLAIVKSGNEQIHLAYVFLNICCQDFNLPILKDNFDYTLDQWNHHCYTNDRSTQSIKQILNWVKNINTLQNIQETAHQLKFRSSFFAFLSCTRKLYRSSFNNEWAVFYQNINDTTSKYLNLGSISALSDQICRDITPTVVNYIHYIETQKREFRYLIKVTEHRPMKQFLHYSSRKSAKGPINLIYDFLTDVQMAYRFKKVSTAQRNEYYDLMIAGTLERFSQALSKILQRLTHFVDGVLQTTTSKLQAEQSKYLLQLYMEYIIIVHLISHFLQTFSENKEGRDSVKLEKYIEEYQDLPALRSFDLYGLIRSQVNFDEQLERLYDKLQIYHPIGLMGKGLEESQLKQLAFPELQDNEIFYRTQLTYIQDQLHKASTFEAINKRYYLVLFKMQTWSDDQLQVFGKFMTMEMWNSLNRFKQLHQQQSPNLGAYIGQYKSLENFSYESETLQQWRDTIVRQLLIQERNEQLSQVKVEQSFAETFSQFQPQVLPQEEQSQPIDTLKDPVSDQKYSADKLKKQLVNIERAIQIHQIQKQLLSQHLRGLEIVLVQMIKIGTDPKYFMNINPNQFQSGMALLYKNLQKINWNENTITESFAQYFWELFFKGDNTFGSPDNIYPQRIIAELQFQFKIAPQLTQIFILRSFKKLLNEKVARIFQSDTLLTLLEYSFIPSTNFGENNAKQKAIIIITRLLQINLAQLEPFIGKYLTNIRNLLDCFSISISQENKFIKKTKLLNYIRHSLLQVIAILPQVQVVSRELITQIKEILELITSLQLVHDYRWLITNQNINCVNLFTTYFWLFGFIFMHECSISFLRNNIKFQILQMEIIHQEGDIEQKGIAIFNELMQNQIKDFGFHNPYIQQALILVSLSFQEDPFDSSQQKWSQSHSQMSKLLLNDPITISTQACQMIHQLIEELLKKQSLLIQRQVALGQSKAANFQGDLGSIYQMGEKQLQILNLGNLFACLLNIIGLFPLVGDFILDFQIPRNDIIYDIYDRANLTCVEPITLLEMILTLGFINGGLSNPFLNKLLTSQVLRSKQMLRDYKLKLQGCVIKWLCLIQKSWSPRNVEQAVILESILQNFNLIEIDVGDPLIIVRLLEQIVIQTKDTFDIEKLHHLKIQHHIGNFYKEYVRNELHERLQQLVQNPKDHLKQITETVLGYYQQKNLYITLKHGSKQVFQDLDHVALTQLPKGIGLSQVDNHDSNDELVDHDIRERVKVYQLSMGKSHQTTFASVLEENEYRYKDYFSRRNYRSEGPASLGPNGTNTTLKNLSHQVTRLGHLSSASSFVEQTYKILISTNPAGLTDRELLYFTLQELKDIQLAKEAIDDEKQKPDQNEPNTLEANEILQRPNQSSNAPEQTEQVLQGEKVEAIDQQSNFQDEGQTKIQTQKSDGDLNQSIEKINSPEIPKQTEKDEEKNQQLLEEAMSTEFQQPAHQNSSNSNDDFDFPSYGYPDNAVKIYEVDPKEFKAQDNEGKRRLLTEAQHRFEAKHRLIKYSKFMTEYEQMILSKYMTQLEGSKSEGQECQPDFKEYLQSEEFLKWFEGLSEKMQQLLTTTLDQSFIKLLPSEVQEKIKEQWKTQCTLQFKKDKQSNQKIDILEITQHLKEAYESSLSLEGKMNQDNQQEQISESQIEPINIKPESHELPNQEDIDTTSPAYLNSNIEICEGVKISRACQKILENPNLFSSLYMIDEKVIQALAPSLLNELDLHPSFQYVTLNPYISVPIIFSAYIELITIEQGLRKTLKQFKQFQDIQILANVELDLQVSLFYPDFIQEIYRRSSIISHMYRLQPALSFIKTFVLQKICQDIIFNKFQDEQFWHQLRTTGSLRSEDGEIEIYLKDILTEKSYSAILDIFESNRGDQQRLCLIDNLANLEVTRGNLVDSIRYPWTMFSYETEWQEKQLTIVEHLTKQQNSLKRLIGQFIQFLVHEAPNQHCSPDPYGKYPKYHPKNSEIKQKMVHFIEKLFYSQSIKGASHSTYLSSQLKEDRGQFFTIMASILKHNLNKCQVLQDMVHERLDDFREILIAETGIKTLEDEKSFPSAEAYDDWKREYANIISASATLLNKHLYVKYNLRWVLRQIRLFVIEQVRSDKQLYTLLLEQTKDESLLKQLLENEINKRIQHVLKDFYDHLFSPGNRICNQLQLIADLGSKLNKLLSLQNKNTPKQSASFVQIFKLPIIYYQIEAKLQESIYHRHPAEISHQEIQPDQEENLVPSPPPKLSRLFTREDPSEPDEMPLLQMKSISHFRQQDVSLEEIYNTFTQNLSGFFTFFAKERQHNAKLWVRLLDNLKLKLDLNTRFEQLQYNLFLIKKIKSENIEDSNEEITILVNREHVWQSTLAVLSRRSLFAIINNDFNIRFENERGIDAGGLTAEWITLVINEIMDPKLGLFILSANKVTLQPNPHSYIIPNHLVHFRYLGRLIASSLLKRVPVEIDLTRSVLKHITRENLYISDLEDIDPDLSRNLLSLLDIDVEPLELSYTHYERVFGELVCIDLGKGFDAPVTNENKKEYIKAVAHYKMTQSIKDQIEQFVGGFEDVIPRRFTEGLDAKGLGLKLSGLKYIDAEDFRDNVQLSEYSKNDQVIIWLIELLKEEFTEEQKANFLFFITGSFKVHFGGFKEMNLTISKLLDQNRLPIAHTCSKHLELPAYESKETMKQKIIFAMDEGSKGFYIS